MAKDTDLIGAMTIAELRAFILATMNATTGPLPPVFDLPPLVPDDPEKYKADKPKEEPVKPARGGA